MMNNQDLKTQFESTPKEDRNTQEKIIQEVLGFQSYIIPVNSNVCDLAAIKAEMKRTGYYWNSNRVKAWMQKAGYQNKHFIDERGAKILLKHLQNMNTIDLGAF